MTRPLSLLAATALLAGACSASGASAVKVVSTNDECRAAATRFTAGTVKFRVVNEGDKVTELYVYGSGDKVIGEVEDVGPGTSRVLTAKLSAGTYELACKPGETGKGIRQRITVAPKT